MEARDYESLLDEVRSEEREGFTIDNDSAADWALRKIAAARTERDRLKAHFAIQEEIADRRVEEAEQRFMPMLEQYFEQVPRHETKTKASYALPSGKLVRKMQGPEYVRDDEKLLAWLKKIGKTGYIKITERPAWGDFKPYTKVVGDRVADSNGEIVDGVQVVERAQVFDVEVNCT